MEMKIYAAYGSNMHLGQMQKRCPRAQVLKNGELLNYRLTFRGKQSGVANVEKMTGGCVPIVLWAITKDCERVLDRYEGYPQLYKKLNVKVATESGEQEAMLYVMAEEYESLPALPSDYYFEIIRQGYEDNGISTEPLFTALADTKAEL